MDIDRNATHVPDGEKGEPPMADLVAVIASAHHLFYYKACTGGPGANISR
jgi:hypothetical protein